MDMQRVSLKCLRLITLFICLTISSSNEMGIQRSLDLCISQKNTSKLCQLGEKELRDFSNGNVSWNLNCVNPEAIYKIGKMMTSSCVIPNSMHFTSLSNATQNQFDILFQCHTSNLEIKWLFYYLIENDICLFLGYILIRKMEDYQNLCKQMWLLKRHEE